MTKATLEEMALIPSPATGEAGSLTPPRSFNLMFQTNVGALADASSVAFLRPETAQGIFTNFKVRLISSVFMIIPSDFSEKQNKCYFETGVQVLLKDRWFGTEGVNSESITRSHNSSLLPACGLVCCVQQNVQATSRVKVPFGIGQVGKAFRNEITPRNFIFRSREFEQMEIGTCHGTVEGYMALWTLFLRAHVCDYHTTIHRTF